MLRSCKYCGRIHEYSFVCGPKRKALEKRWAGKNSDAKKFRHSNIWTQKSRQIRERDGFLCLCCKAGEQGTVRMFNASDLEVHHIIPIDEDYERRLDNNNLITVCRAHHELCERGQITRQQQRQLAEESIREDEDIIVV